MALPDGGERRTGSTGTPRETETPRNRQAMRPNRFLPKERPRHFPGRFPILFGRIPENIWWFFPLMGTPFLAEESEKEGNRLVYRLVNSLTHRERRFAAPARRATEDGGGHSWVIRRENHECPPSCYKHNEGGAEAAALECQGICETV